MRLHLSKLLAWALVIGAPWQPGRAGESAEPFPKLFMWKATNQVGAVVYLVGSLPLGVPDLYPLPPAMEAAFAKSSTLFEEVDTTRVDRGVMQRRVKEAGSYPAEDSLPKHISKKTNDLLNAFCQENGLPIASIDALKLWIVVATVKTYLEHKFELDTTSGIDLHFLLEANANKMKIQELESADFQYNLLAGVSDRILELKLAHLLKAGTRMDEDARELKEAWLAGDEAAVQRDFARSFEGADQPGSASVADIEDMLRMQIYDRNGPMAEKIAAAMEPGSCSFVVIGAEHLTGEHGILSLLSEQGCTVEQVKSQ